MWKKMLVSFLHLWSCLLLKEAEFHKGSDKIGSRQNQIKFGGAMAKNMFCTRAKTGVAKRPR